VSDKFGGARDFRKPYMKTDSGQHSNAEQEVSFGISSSTPSRGGLTKVNDATPTGPSLHNSSGRI
jgi:hypothetical protein